MNFIKRCISLLCTAVLLCPTLVSLTSAETTNAAAEMDKPEIILSSSDAAVRKEEADTVLTWEVHATGVYYVRVRYRYVTEGRSNVYGFLSVNSDAMAGKEEFAFQREYSYNTDFQRDIFDNDVTPTIAPVLEETVNYLYDSDGLYSDRLSFDLQNEINTVSMYFPSEVTVSEVVLEPVENTKSYSQVVSEYRTNGIDIYSGEMIKQQAEAAICTSGATLYPISDRSSSMTEPSQSGKIRLNTIGGYRWQNVGEYVEWMIEAPQDGLYRLMFRVRQNVISEQTSHRILMVNGRIPFEEAQDIVIESSNDWSVQTLGDSEERLIYLKKGQNSIRLQATLGKMDTILRGITDSLDALNDIYLSLLVIMGSSPDTLRDYKLDEVVPEQLDLLKKQQILLQELTRNLEACTGSGNSGVALLNTLLRQLNKMCKDCDEIPSEFSYFKSNIGSVSTWLSEARKQPLEIDYIAIDAPEHQIPKADSGFFAQLWFDIKEFVCSYFTDYESIGELSQTDFTKELRVWVSSGRDQAQTLRNLISKSFLKENNISVKVELVTTSLLAATVAGTGPDVVVLSAPDVFNFAMRKGAYKLEQFSDFAEIKQRFHETSFIPYKYLDGTYALPESINFNVLYYRTDLFEQMGLNIPETWDELLYISSLLANNNMEVGIPADYMTYLTMVSQAGLDIYSADGKKCMLGQIKQVDTFGFFTKLYTDYGFLLSYEFQNRFRSGEMPLGIADISMFNTLEVSAPEIRGLWSMTLLPGMVREDGTIDHTSLLTTSTTGANGGGAMILSQTDDPESAWEFLKWWTSAEVQESYAVEFESLLGASARYSSANITAFEHSMWTAQYKGVLQKQMQSLNAVPNIPGGYYLSRHLNNAFRKVVYNSKSATDVMYDYVYKIDSEIEKKRNEFGLN